MQCSQNHVKKSKKSLPTYPIFFRGMVTGTTHIFLFGLIIIAFNVICSCLDITVHFGIKEQSLTHYRKTIYIVVDCLPDKGHQEVDFHLEI